MINLVICLIYGHNFEIISHTSNRPNDSFRFEMTRFQGELPFSFEASLVGYTKTVQICKRCGKVHSVTKLGQ